MGKNGNPDLREEPQDGYRPNPHILFFLIIETLNDQPHLVEVTNENLTQPKIDAATRISVGHDWHFYRDGKKDLMIRVHGRWSCQISSNPR